MDAMKIQELIDAGVVVEIPGGFKFVPEKSGIRMRRLYGESYVDAGWYANAIEAINAVANYKQALV